MRFARLYSKGPENGLRVKGYRSLIEKAMLIQYRFSITEMSKLIRKSIKPRKVLISLAATSSSQDQMHQLTQRADLTVHF